MNASLKKQEGVVIIIALFMVTLMASLAYLMIEQAARDTRRTQLILQDTKANLVATGAVLWAKDVLTQNWLHQKPNTRVDVMPLTLKESEVQGYRVRASLSDSQGSFNINNLMGDDAEPDFLRLLKVVAPAFSESEAQALTHHIVLWLKPVTTNDVLDREYAKQALPYRAGHRMMAHISELKLVKGMTPALYAALAPYLTALPDITTLNPETVSAPVFCTLSPGITLSTANAFITLRDEKPVVNKTEFKALPLIANHTINMDKIDMISTYFLLKTVVSRDDIHWVTYSLLERSRVNGRAVVRVINQRKGSV